MRLRMAVDISALGSSLTVWELAGYAATGIVMLGVIGESIVEFTNWITDERWQSMVGRASALVLVAGLAGEILTQVQVNSISGRMIAFLNTQVSQAVTSAGKLGLKVDTMSEFVTRKERDADSAIARMDSKSHELTTAEDRLDAQLARINARISPRTIADPLFATLRVQLRAYAGQPFELTAYEDKSDTVPLALRIDFLLINAGWQYIQPKGVMIGAKTGIDIFVGEGASARTIAAGNALVDALNSAHLNAEFKSASGAETPVNKIGINVGLKPLLQ